jgi:hypothetical protein
MRVLRSARVSGAEQVATTRGQRPQRCGTAAGEGNSSRGMNRVAGKPPDRTRARDSFRVQVRGRRKRNEPHGRYQVAINLGLVRRASRHGGEKPRRRNMLFGWYRADEAASFGTMWEKPAHRECRRRGKTNDHERRFDKHNGFGSCGRRISALGRTVGEQSSRGPSQDGHPDCLESGSLEKPRRSARQRVKATEDAANTKVSRYETSRTGKSTSSDADGTNGLEGPASPECERPACGA